MNQVALREPGARSVLLDMSDRYGMEPTAFEATLRATVVPRECSPAQFAAFLLVAKEYKLNPILKEIYAFPSKGGIQPIVGVDGWANLINSHPAFDGMDFEDHFNQAGDLVSITCKMHRKDRTHAITATEYLAECKRGTEPWKQWPRRMLRHKAMIQAARYAFSFAGIIDPDEAERFAGEMAQDVTPRGQIVPISQRIADAAAEDSNSSQAPHSPGTPSVTDTPATDEAAAQDVAGNNSEAKDEAEPETETGAPVASALPPDWQDVYLTAMSRVTDRPKSLTNRHTEALTLFGAEPNDEEFKWITAVYQITEDRLRGKITKAEADKLIAEIKDQ